METEIREGDADAFFAAPFAAYGDRTPYVSPLKSDLARFVDRRLNPLFSDPESAIAIFTAHRGNRVLGRITAHVHGASNRLHGLCRGYFGYFDVADDAGAANALLERVEMWHRARGMDEVIGNFNLTAMQQVGVMTDGFDKAPYTDQVWSPPWLPGHLAARGYEPVFGMTTFELDLTRHPPPRLGQSALEILKDPEFAFAPVTRSTIPARMEEARLILNAAFANNPMFVPVTADEFHFQAKDMKWIMDPRLSAVLHWRGKPAACIVAIPDLNPLLRTMGSRFTLAAPWHFIRHRLTNRRAVLIFSGVIPELQGRGVHPLLLTRVVAEAGRAGYRQLGNTWIADVNGPSLAQTEKAGATPLHRLNLFRRAL